MTSVSVVEVRHKVYGRHQGVRLVIDGVDVTRSSTLTRGRLHFDPDRAPIAVELDSGVHRAVVRRVELPRVGQKHRVVDSYEWSFTVL